MLRNQQRSLALSIAAGLACTGALRADELWRQDHADCSVNPSHCYGGPASQQARNAGGPGWMYETVDNFDAAAGWTITNLEFWGGQATTTPAVTQGFMIRFYADNNGQVGQLISTQDVMTFTQETYFTWIPALPLEGYHYTLTLNTPFAVPAAGRYWMSIVAIQNYGGPNDRQWGWNLSDSTHPPYAQQNSSPPGGSYDPQTYDVAFVLYGSGGTPPCYPNCDQSTAPPVLNVLDFNCFLNRFSAGASYANCDHSTVPPVLNVLDFNCFLNSFAAGCP
jgi:hypothetical protein